MEVAIRVRYAKDLRTPIVATSRLLTLAVCTRTAFAGKISAAKIKAQDAYSRHFIPC